MLFLFPSSQVQKTQPVETLARRILDRLLLRVNGEGMAEKVH